MILGDEIVWLHLKIESRGKLIFDADSLGMLDGKVSKKELYDLIDQYDEDNDSDTIKKLSHIQIRSCG
jgi:hypothetical protein